MAVTALLAGGIGFTGVVITGDGALCRPLIALATPDALDAVRVADIGAVGGESVSLPVSWRLVSGVPMRTVPLVGVSFKETAEAGDFPWTGVSNASDTC